MSSILSLPSLVKISRVAFSGLMIVLVLMIMTIPVSLITLYHPIPEAHADFLKDASNSIQATACWWHSWLDGNNLTQYHAMDAAKKCF
jgi:hypothetical protein